MIARDFHREVTRHRIFAKERKRGREGKKMGLSVMQTGSEEGTREARGQN